MSTEHRANRREGRLLRTLRYLLPYWRWEVLALLVAILTSILGLVFPWINKIIVDNVVMQKDLALLRTVCLALVVASVFQATFRMLENYLFTYIGERAVVDLRCDLLSSLFASSISHHDGLKVGRVMSTVTNDVAAMQGLYTSTLVNALTDGLKLLLTFSMLLWIDWRTSLAIVPGLFLFAAVVRDFSPALRTLARKVQGETAVFSGDLQEALGGIREIKALRREDRELERHGGTLRRLMGLRMRRQLSQAGASVGAESVAMITMALALFLCGLRVLVDEMQVGLLVAYTHYVSSLFSPVARVTELNSRLQSSLGSADRVFDLLDAARDHRERRRSRQLPVVTGQVAFREVDFSYEPGKPTLERVSLTVAAGQKAALVGPSGAGKTTLAMLLLGFYDYEGEITIDGHEVREIALSSLRSQVGAVFQDTFLFDLTVAENLRLGRPDATFEQVQAAARSAHAHEFVCGLPEGYDTRIGERGIKLSGGQKQRLAIARTFLLDPRILILDEATSALDSESESLVLAALDRLMRGRTTLVIAHRLTTVAGADHIVVMDHGRIIESGTHDELLERGELYPQLYRRQLGKSPDLTPAAAR